MKRKRNRIFAAAGLVLLLLSLLLPAWAGALAQGEDWIAISIQSETPVYSAEGEQIGRLMPDENQGVNLVLASNETFPNVSVSYSPQMAERAVAIEALAGKSPVQFSMAQEGTEEISATLPAEGWIDANRIVNALNQQHVLDTETIMDQAAQIDAFSNEQPSATPEGSATPEPIREDNRSFFGPEKMAIWVPIAAVGMGICGVVLLAWIALSASATAWETRKQAERLAKLNEKIAEGLSLKSPVQVEQTAWPKQAMVEVNSEALDYMAKNLTAYSPLNQSNAPEQPAEPPPPPVPEGEEPDLLALANRLAGVVSIPEWQTIVKSAGWHAVLLKANPNEKGTYIADESGYSVIACLMRGEEADIGYVLPSHQDANASEPRWSEFFNITEEMSVRNYQVDALPVMFIERGAFYLQKSVGRLTRRKQYS